MPIDTSALTPQQQITAVYIAYYDRAPDPAGLQFWTDQLNGGRSLEQIATDFSGAAETKAKFPFFDAPDVASPDTFINSIYLNLFGRLPDQAGATFWGDQLALGTTPVGEIILAILEGAQDAASGGFPDSETITNKIDVGLDWAQSAIEAGIGLSNNPIAEEIDGEVVVNDQAAFDSATSILDGVDETAQSVTDAKAATDAFIAGAAIAGQTFTLTEDTDAGVEFVGSAADEVFDAPLAPAIDGLVGAQTLQGPDVLDGGAGVDTLNAELNNTGITQNPTISGIEVYNLTAFSVLLGADSQLDLDRATGYEQLWNRNSRSDLTLNNVGEVAILGLDNVRDGTEYGINYDNIAVAEQTVVSMMSGRPGDAVTLDIDNVDGVIGTLTLNVSDDNYLFLDSDAADSENLVIAGSGLLELEGEDEFGNVQTLDTLGYDGNVNLDVSGSADLTSVMTADGDDTVLVGSASVNGNLAVDMGAGFDILNVDDVADDAALNAVDFTGGVTGVENIAFDDAMTLGGNAVLDLDGVSDDLETVWFFDGFDANGSNLAIANSPVQDLNINTIGDIAEDGDFDMGGGLLTVDGVVNLTIDAQDNADVDGGLNGDVLETLVVNAGDDLDLDLFDGLDALVSIEANATGTSPSVGVGSSANVNLDASAGAIGDDTEFDALNTVNVNAATNATLNMTGRAGTAAFAGTQATQSFSINVTGAGGFPPPSANGNVFFTSGALAAGFVDTNYSTTGGVSAGNGSAQLDNGAASDVASELDGTAELEATSTGNVANVTWADVGVVDQLAYQAGSSGATTGSLDSVVPGAFTQGQEAITQVDGEGFVAVETVSVDAQDGDADVDLTDVYGLFTLNVTATDDADVDLFNTNATSATVAAGTDAGDTATITVGGDTVGNAELVDLVVSGDEADVTLADNLDSFTTLNVSAVASDVDADTSGAVFTLAAGEFVEYQIGATSDGVDGTTDVDFTGNTDAREIYNFVGDDIGEVEINDFDVSADATDPGDRLDLSGFAESAGQLVFSIDGSNDIVITDLSGGLGDFGGEIKIVGTFDAADASDLANFNIIYG